MHKTRVITSIIGLFILISIISFGNILFFWLVVSAATVVGLLEFYKIAQAREFPVYLLPGVLLGWLLSLVPLLASVFKTTTLPEFTLTLILLSLFLYALLTKRALSESVQALAITIFGIYYVSWLLGHLVFLRGLVHGKEFVFYVLLIVWSGDTGAYYSGSSFGKHKFAPMISPKKSIEGAVGGLLASLAASCIAKLTFFPFFSWPHYVVLALLLSVIAQLGDLCESMLKRAVNVKDSGSILPGHGGILDRLDGVMFATPILYYYAVIFLAP